MIVFDYENYSCFSGTGAELFVRSDSGTLPSLTLTSLGFSGISRWATPLPCAGTRTRSDTCPSSLRANTATSAPAPPRFSTVTVTPNEPFSVGRVDRVTGRRASEFIHHRRHALRALEGRL